MSEKKTLTFCLMDPPFENARTTTALRLIDSAVRQGHNVNVFAYEGAVCIPFSKQSAHANSVHGFEKEAWNHPLPKDWVTELMKHAEKSGAKVDWINCGLCVDERGMNEAVPGVRRGSPTDFVNWANSSHNTLVIPTK